MKNLFTIVLLSFLFFACQNDTQQTSTTTTETADAHAGHDHDGHDHAKSGEGTHVKASPLSPYLGKWTYYAAIKDPKYYKDRWIDFKGDGSFLSGIGNKQTNTGKWILDDVNNFLTLDYTDDTKDKDDMWKTQKNTADVIILLGNSPKNATGEQIKLERAD